MKFSKSIFCLCILCLLFLSKIYAQTPTPTPQFPFRTDLIPPSPNAASLGTYGVVPVSLQTGIPDISIPITVAKGTQLSIPVTLNYHGGGFKPSEDASWVGLNWSLDAGGVITRVIQDKLDESMADNGSYPNTEWRYHTLDSMTQKFMDNSMYLFDNDTQPDIYSFNFAGHSGKFIICKGKIYQFPFQQLIIGGDPTTGFTIVTPEGDQYSFNTPEGTTAPHNPNFDHNNPVYNMPTNFNSSWYLSSITSPDYKDQITFTYASANTLVRNSPATQNLSVLINTGAGVPTLSAISYPFPTQIATLRLTKITTSKMVINFNAVTGRTDLPTYALDNIQVLNYQGQLLDQFKFNVDYFTPTSGSGIYPTRLKLTGLDEGTNPLTLKKYRFNYTTETLTASNKLPFVDHWGYSNKDGEITSNVLVPNTLYVGGVNKDPDFPHTQAGMLNKIYYPTGGVSIFTYEPNLIYNGLNYVRNNLMDEDIIQRADSTTTDLQTHTTSINLSTAQMVYIYTTRVPKIPVTSGINDPNGPNSPTKDTAPEVVISKSGVQYFSGSILVNHDNYQKIDSVFLQPGVYSILLQCDAKENFVSGTLKYYQLTNQVIEGKLGPGIRIKQVVNYTDPEATKIASVKRYIYKDSTGVSTGVLLNNPNYGGRDYTEEIYNSVGIGDLETTNHYVTYTSANGAGLPIGQDMYYQKVYEQQVSNTDTLMSKSEFNLYDPADYNGTNVYLTRKTDFKKSGAAFAKVYQHDYNYSIITDSSFFAVKIYLYLKKVPIGGNIINGVAPDDLRHYSFETNEIIPTWLKLKSEKEYNYYNLGDTVITTSTYTYDAGPRNRVLVTTTDSKGRTIVEKNKYQGNYAISVSTPGINSVVEKQVWLKRGITDSVLMSGVITEYDATARKPKNLYGFENATQVSSLNQETKNGNGLYTALLSDTRYKPRLTNTFDAYSNLASQDLTNFSSGTTHQVGYLWGYHNNYPIAQVKNANLAGVAYTSFEDDDNSWTYTAASVITTDARTGVKCYSGTISKSSLPSGNYSVSLWAKGSGTITVGGVAKIITSNWAWYEWQLTGITSVTINSNGNKIDEVRLLPANALMTTYTFSPEVGVTSITDTRGITQFCDYDEFGRIANIKDKDGNILKNFNYNYAVQGPAWTDTGAKQCVQSNGVNTGEEQMQQQDLNPLSSTYNQYQWRSLGNTGNCPVPVTIYIKMTVASASTHDDGSGNIHTYNTYSFKSYSDANCTVPLTLSSALTVNYQVKTTIVFNLAGKPNSIVTTNNTITIAANANNATSPSIDISGCTGSGDKGSCSTSNVTLQPGTGYIPYIIPD